jgi:hypothetical protein
MNKKVWKSDKVILTGNNKRTRKTNPSTTLSSKNIEKADPGWNPVDLLSGKRQAK